MMPQSELTPEHLAAFLSRLDRAQLLHAAKQAYAVRKTTAAADVMQACAELVS